MEVSWKPVSVKPLMLQAVSHRCTPMETIRKQQKIVSDA